MSVPWTIRNAVSLDAFVPTSTNTGDTLCLDRVDGADGGFRWVDARGVRRPAAARGRAELDSTRKAIGFVLEHPGRELLQIVRRARYIFGTDRDGIEASPPRRSGRRRVGLDGAHAG